MILSDFVLFDSNSQDIVSNEWRMPPEATQITIQATGLQDKLRVQGIVDEVGGDWIDLAAINLTDFSVSAEITTDGAYAVGVSGIKSIITKYGGDAGTIKVYGVCEG